MAGDGAPSMSAPNGVYQVLIWLDLYTNRGHPELAGCPARMSVSHVPDASVDM
jgi:hypothetical protein